MALRRPLGWSDGELMRSDAKPCSRLMRQTAAIFSVGGGLAFWVLCRLHYVFKKAQCAKRSEGLLEPRREVHREGRASRTSKNNCSEKSEVGFLRCDISELLVGSSSPSFQS